MIEGQMKLRRNMNGIYKYYSKRCYLVVVVDFFPFKCQKYHISFLFGYLRQNYKILLFTKILHYIKMCVKYINNKIKLKKIIKPITKTLLSTIKIDKLINSNIAPSLVINMYNIHLTNTC